MYIIRFQALKYIKYDIYEHSEAHKIVYMAIYCHPMSFKGQT